MDCSISEGQDRKDAWTSTSSKEGTSCSSGGSLLVVSHTGKVFFSCLHTQERRCPDVLSPLLSPSMSLVQIC